MRHLVLLSALLLSLVGCNNESTPASIVAPIAFVDTVVSVPFDQAVTVPGTDISLRFVQIPYDGRLPSGVVEPLWWTNTANIAVTIEPSNANLRLYISGEIPDSSGVHFDGAPVVCQGFSFRLVELIPLPTTLLVTPPDSELVARIEIRDTTMPPESSPCPFPLALGNQWVYLDSTFDHDTLLSVTTDTVTIYDEYTDQNGHWWLFDSWLSPFGRIAKGSADTLFSQQSAYGPLPPGDPLYFPSKELIPPIGDSSSFMIFVDGDMVSYRSVKLLTSAVVTPAGSFDTGYSYSVKLGPISNSQIFVPDVGFIFREEKLEYTSGPRVTKRFWLISYSLH